MIKFIGNFRITEYEVEGTSDHLGHCFSTMAAHRNSRGALKILQGASNTGGVRVRSLVGELRSHVSGSMVKGKKEKKN